MYNSQDIREYKRIEKPLMVRFRTITPEATKMVFSEWNMVNVKDLSAGGIFFHYTKDLATGTLLDLKITIPGSMLTINCIGKIIRSDKLEPTSAHGIAKYGIAVNFINIGEKEEAMINTSVEEMLRKRYKCENQFSHA